MPRYASLRKGADPAQHLRAMAYRQRGGAAGGGGAPGWESTDEYVTRMQGYIALYAAFLQAEQPGHAHGLEHGWAFCARCAPRPRCRAVQPARPAPAHDLPQLRAARALLAAGPAGASPCARGAARTRAREGPRPRRAGC